MIPNGKKTDPKEEYMLANKSLAGRILSGALIMDTLSSNYISKFSTLFYLLNICYGFLMNRGAFQKHLWALKSKSS